MTPDTVRARVHRIAVIGGDGIGPEVMAEALRVLDAVEGLDGFATVRSGYELGARRYLETGEVLGEHVIDRLRDEDVILLGAIGSPEAPPGLLERDLLLELRRRFDLYINVRPMALFDGVRSPLRDLIPDRCDMVIVRENTESLYTGAGGVAHRGTRAEIATQESLNTFHGVERAIRYAFEIARTRPRRHLTMVHKTNVLTYAGRLWARVFEDLAAAFPDVDTDYLHVDAACLHLVADPGRFDVVVTDNLFGDIITDLAAGVQGGIGLAASANLNPERVAPSMFEPIHGSAPDIAGTGRADPSAAVLSLALMLEFLDECAAARRIRAAVRAYLRARRGGESTSEVGDRLVTLLGKVDGTEVEEASRLLMTDAR